MTGLALFFGWLKEGDAQNRPDKKPAVTQSPSRTKLVIHKSKAPIQPLISGMMVPRRIMIKEGVDPGIPEMDTVLDEIALSTQNLPSTACTSIAGAYNAGPPALGVASTPAYLQLRPLEVQEVPIHLPKRSFWKRLQFWK